MIPKSHPRYDSLRIRHMLAAGFDAGAVVAEGMIAHGRGEAFDYLNGERTGAAAATAIRAAAATLMLSSRPVISVNGNAAALCSDDITTLARAASAKVEVNLFYDEIGRRRIVAGLLRTAGCKQVLGVDDESGTLPGIESDRRRSSVQGILSADTVLVMLEDGDRTEALRRAGKRVIVIDLNPMSRSARHADITIIDNIVRALPLMVRYCTQMASHHPDAIKSMVDSYNNAYVLRQSMAQIQEHVGVMHDA